MPRGQTIKMLYEQQEKQKQLQLGQNVPPAPSCEISITTSDTLMSQFVQPQLLSPPQQGPTNSVMNGSGGNNGVVHDSVSDDVFTGQSVTYVPLHQVASTFSEIVDVAGWFCPCCGL